MPRRFVDLSIYLDGRGNFDPPHGTPKIEYKTHAETVPDLLRIFPGLKKEDLPDGMGWAAERLTITTHNGTHVDAPYHYHPTMNNGERAWTIDEVPLEWFFQPGVKLDFRRFPDGYVASAKDVDDELKRIGHGLMPLEIVLFNTSAGAAQGTTAYMSSGCGMGREATMYLLDHGIRVVGTDAWGWDAPFVHTARRFQETKDPSIVWEGHKAGRFGGYSQIEKMTNLDKLPPSGFMVSCFPHKVRGGSGGWTRAVAIFDS